MQPKDLDSLKPDLKNPRRMSDHDGQSLSSSLDYFGDLSPLVNNVQLDLVVGGHMRMETVLAKDPAAKIHYTEQLAEPDPTGTTAWGFVLFNGRRLAYREVRWDEVKHGEANIAANRIRGEFDWEKLAEYDQWLLDQGSDLTHTGQSPDEIQHLLGNAPAKPDNSDGRKHLSVKLTEAQLARIEEAIQQVKHDHEVQNPINNDADGNALAFICHSYLETLTTTPTQ